MPPAKYVARSRSGPTVSIGEAKRAQFPLHVDDVATVPGGDDEASAIANTDQRSFKDICSCLTDNLPGGGLLRKLT
jgi:hypothetical protein